MFPLSGSRLPTRTCKRVDLPDPLGPVISHFCLAPTVIDVVGSRPTTRTFVATRMAPEFADGALVSGAAAVSPLKVRSFGGLRICRARRSSSLERASFTLRETTLALRSA